MLDRHTADEIYDVIAENDGLYLVNFSLASLHICAHLRADLERLSDSFQDAIGIGEVQLLPTSEAIHEFDLNSIPTLLLFKGPAEIERVEQFWTYDALEEYLSMVTSFYSAG